MHKWPPTLIQDIALFLSKRDSFGTLLAWMEQRKGRCTASYLKDICTLMDKGRTNPQHLLKKILQTEPHPSNAIPALKYGHQMVQMEDVAAVEYQRISSSRNTNTFACSKLVCLP